MSVSLVRRDRTSNATSIWLDGHQERCLINPNIPERDGMRYVSRWVGSIRTVRMKGDAWTCERPAGWHAASRVVLDSSTHERMSPNGVSHLIVRGGNCATCGRGRHREWQVAA